MPIDASIQKVPKELKFYMLFSATIVINFTLQKTHLKNTSVVAPKQLPFYINSTIKALFLLKITIGFGGDLPFVAYFHFEATARCDLFLYKKMYVISFCTVFAFHSKLNIDRTVAYGRFQQKQEELFDLDHLKEQMLQYVDRVTLNQPKDA